MSSAVTNIAGISVESLDKFLSEIKSVKLAKTILNSKFEDVFLYRKDIERCPSRVAQFFNIYPPDHFFYTDLMADVLLNSDFLSGFPPSWVLRNLINNPLALGFCKELSSFYIDYTFMENDYSVLEVNLTYLKWAINNYMLLSAAYALEKAL